MGEKLVVQWHTCGCSLCVPLFCCCVHPIRGELFFRGWGRQWGNHGGSLKAGEETGGDIILKWDTITNCSESISLKHPKIIFVYSFTKEQTFFFSTKMLVGKWALTCSVCATFPMSLVSGPMLLEAMGVWRRSYTVNRRTDHEWSQGEERLTVRGTAVQLRRIMFSPAPHRQNTHCSYLS